MPTDLRLLQQRRGHVVRPDRGRKKDDSLRRARQRPRRPQPPQKVRRRPPRQDKRLDRRRQIVQVLHIADCRRIRSATENGQDFAARKTKPAENSRVLHDPDGGAVPIDKGRGPLGPNGDARRTRQRPPPDHKPRQRQRRSDRRAPNGQPGRRDSILSRGAGESPRAPAPKPGDARREQRARQQPKLPFPINGVQAAREEKRAENRKGQWIAPPERQPADRQQKCPAQKVGKTTQPAQLGQRHEMSANDVPFVQDVPVEAGAARGHLPAPPAERRVREHRSRRARNLDSQGIPRVHPPERVREPRALAADRAHKAERQQPRRANGQPTPQSQAARKRQKQAATPRHQPKERAARPRLENAQKRHRRQGDAQARDENPASARHGFQPTAKRRNGQRRKGEKEQLRQESARAVRIGEPEPQTPRVRLPDVARRAFGKGTRRTLREQRAQAVGRKRKTLREVVRHAVDLKMAQKAIDEREAGLDLSARQGGVCPKVGSRTLPCPHPGPVPDQRPLRRVHLPKERRRAVGLHEAVDGRESNGRQPRRRRRVRPSRIKRPARIGQRQG